MSERIATPIHGHAAAMRYQYRARIESAKRLRIGWRGFYTVRMYRPVIERKHTGWTDDGALRWYHDRETARTAANEWLDAIERPPRGEYV